MKKLAIESILMNTLLLFAIFLITGCSTVSHRRPSSEDPWKVLVSLDTHVHIESGKGYEDSLNNTFLSHSLLLSSSYSINSPKDFSNRLVADEDVSKIVSQYPLKFSGLCGLNLSWPDATEVLTKCLKMPGMVGVKIHDLGDPDSFSENDKFKALKEVLKIMSSRNLILLWHVRSDPSMDNEKFRREVNKIIISSTLNKNIYFVFAHAVDSLDHTLHLQIVLDSMRSLKTRPENIFIELSGTMDICENEPTEEKNEAMGKIRLRLYTSWKRFIFAKLAWTSRAGRRAFCD